MKLDVVFSKSGEQKMDVRYHESGCELDADFGEIQSVNIGGEIYDGDYTVTPKVAAQTMKTKGKAMVDDVTIKAIPFFNVSNTSGGSTVYIAREI